MLISIFLLIAFIYILAVFWLDRFYSGRYFWDNNCKSERFCTAMLQPFMEIFGNRMTAHFWHFKKIILNKKHKTVLNQFVLNLKSNQSTKPFRIFDKGRVLAVLTSVWVDINLFQTCVIVSPKTYIGQWKIFFAIGSEVFQEEKCSHAGAVKLVVDGTGVIWGRSVSGDFIELEVIEYCRAYQNTHILFV